MTKAVDTDGFLRVIEAHKGIIYKVSRAYCRQDEDRQDLIQEIIIQIWNSYSKYNNQYQISTWIYRIALNVSISLYRRNSVRQKMIVPLTNTINYIDDSHANEKEGDILLLYQFIHELNNLDKAMMLLYLEQKNYREIAEILDISETNVATKIGRVKRIIKQKFLAYKK
jgi:RNA polymerase sigma factor (sigma-70 family)